MLCFCQPGAFVFSRPGNLHIQNARVFTTAPPVLNANVNDIISSVSTAGVSGKSGGLTVAGLWVCSQWHSTYNTLYPVELHCIITFM